MSIVWLFFKDAHVTSKETSSAFKEPLDKLGARHFTYKNAYFSHKGAHFTGKGAYFTAKVGYSTAQGAHFRRKAARSSVKGPLCTVKERCIIAKEAQYRPKGAHICRPGIQSNSSPPAFVHTAADKRSLLWNLSRAGHIYCRGKEKGM